METEEEKTMIRYYWAILKSNIHALMTKHDTGYIVFLNKRPPEWMVYCCDCEAVHGKSD